MLSRGGKVPGIEMSVRESSKKHAVELTAAVVIMNEGN